MLSYRKKPIPDPGSRGEKGTESRIWIRYTVIAFRCPLPVLNDFGVEYQSLKFIQRKYCTYLSGGVGGYAIWMGNIWYSTYPVVGT